MDVTPSPVTLRPRRRSRRSLSLQANTGLRIASNGVALTLSLFVSPFIISQLGLATFGLWALISAVSQYATLMDFGVGGAALARFVGQLSAMDEDEALARKGVSALWMSVGFAIAIIGISLGACALLPAFLSHSPATGWRWAIVGVGVNLACASVASTFEAFPSGFSRWDLQIIPALVAQVAYAIAVVCTLLAGLGLEGLGIAAATSGLMMLVTARLVLRLVWSQRWGIWHASVKEIRTLIAYGANIQTASLVVIINQQSDKPVLLAFGASLSFIGLYELASKVAFSVRSLPVAALGPLLVRAATSTAGQSRAAIATFYERALRANIEYAVAPLFAVYGACYPLTLAWLGGGFRMTALMVLILGAGYATNFLTGAGTAVANGSGRPQLDRNYSLLGLAINIIGTVLFGLLFGPWGVIVATALGLMISSLWLLKMMDTWLDTATLSMGWLSANGLQSMLAGLFFGGLGVLATVLLPVQSRLGWLAIGLASIALSTVVLVTVSPTARQWVLAYGTRWRNARADSPKADVGGATKE